jgi:hypothetical protein
MLRYNFLMFCILLAKDIMSVSLMSELQDISRLKFYTLLGMTKYESNFYASLILS